MSTCVSMVGEGGEGGLVYSSCKGVEEGEGSDRGDAGEGGDGGEGGGDRMSMLPPPPSLPQ